MVHFLSEDLTILLVEFTFDVGFCLLHIVYFHVADVVLFFRRVFWVEVDEVLVKILLFFLLLLHNFNVR